MIPERFDLHSIQMFARDINNKFAALMDRNVDMNGRRIINAGKSVGSFDYVTRMELNDGLSSLSKEQTDVIQGLLNIDKPVRYDVFANRGPAIAYDGRVFIATDFDHIGWYSNGAAWKYIFGVREIAQASIAAFVANLGTNDEGCLINVTDYTHSLRWTGSTTEFAPGDSGSFYFQDFPGTPTGGTWGLCDGTAYTYLQADGTTASYTTKNLTGHYRKSVTSSADATVAAIAPGFSGSSSTVAAHSHDVDPPNTTSGNNSASQEVMAGVGVTVAANTHTHDVDIALFGSGSAGGHSHGVGTYAVDATGEPAAFKVLTYLR